MTTRDDAAAAGAAVGAGFKPAPTEARQSPPRRTGRGPGGRPAREVVAGDGGVLFAGIAGEAARSWRRRGLELADEAAAMPESDAGRVIAKLTAGQLVDLAARLEATIALAADGRSAVIDRAKLTEVGETFFACLAAESAWRAYCEATAAAALADLGPVGHA